VASKRPPPAWGACTVPVRKRVRNGHTSWGYYFDLPGSTREGRDRISKWGFASKKEAIDQEADRRKQERAQREAAARGVASPLPKTLGELVDEFCTEFADKDLAAKTSERYRDMIRYLSAELVAMPVAELSALHLTREWNRLRASGGHHRRTKEARPLSRKSVANIRGVVSSAFRWAGGQRLVGANPARASVMPRGGEKRQAVALTPKAQKQLVASSLHWKLPDILEVAAGLGARRGEVLALRWIDIQNGEAKIGRSLEQTRLCGLRFKEPKTAAGYRSIAIPDLTLQVLDRIRAKQQEFRAQFGPDYRADLDLVFSNPDGTPLKPDSVSGTASALCRRMKMPKGVGLHTLRHTHGSQLIAGGMELPAVSKRLGHSSPAVTAKIYSHMLDGRDRAAADLWNKINAAEVDATDQDASSQYGGTPPGRHARKTGGTEATLDDPGSTQNEILRPN
jgi:integrase